MECQIEKNKWGQCCCICKYHLPVYHHCTTNPILRDQLERCICSMFKSWACVPPEGFNCVHDEWDEHSIGCEMFEKAEQKNSYVTREEFLKRDEMAEKLRSVGSAQLKRQKAMAGRFGFRNVTIAIVTPPLCGRGFCPARPWSDTPGAG